MIERGYVIKQTNGDRLMVSLTRLNGQVSEVTRIIVPANGATPSAEKVTH